MTMYNVTFIFDIATINTIIETDKTEGDEIIDLAMDNLTTEFGAGLAYGYYDVEIEKIS